MSDSRIVIKETKQNEFYFLFVDEAGETVCMSDIYRSKRSCLNGIEVLKKLAGQAGVVDETR